MSDQNLNSIGRFMKKTRGILLALIAAVMLFLLGCNRQLIDTTYHFNYAYVSLPNGQVVEGIVESWRDFENGDQLQVRIDGVTYLSNSTNIVLVSR